MNLPLERARAALPPIYAPPVFAIARTSQFYFHKPVVRISHPRLDKGSVRCRRNPRPGNDWRFSNHQAKARPALVAIDIRDDDDSFVPPLGQV